MRNPKLFFLSVSSLLILLSSLSLISCQYSRSEETALLLADSTAAYFDYLNYVGDDDFYNENPLPGDDYFYNPILPGWYSDPSICKRGKDFFLVTSTFAYFPGVPIFHSTDLMNWQQIGHVLDRAEQLPLDGQRTSRGIFAPAISYNPNNETFYMITTNVGVGNFYVKTKDPFSTWSDPIWLPQVHGIDPSFYFEKDDAYIVYNDEPDGGSTYNGHRAIRIIKFDAENDSTVGQGKMIVSGGVDISKKPIWVEGPHLYKINGQYILMCAEGGTSYEHSEVIFKGESPTGKYTPCIYNPILTQRQLPEDRERPITCTGHADLVSKINGQWWSVFLACRPYQDNNENLGRETYMLPVHWNNKGVPYILEEEEVVPRIVKMEGVKRSANVTFGNFEKHYDFKTSELDLELFNLRGNASNLYALDKVPGYLALSFGGDVSNADEVPAYIARRIQHHKFECSTHMYFKPKSSHEAAGMLIYKNEAHHYQILVTRHDQQSTLVLQKVDHGKISTLNEKVLKEISGAIDLKVCSDGPTLSMYYKCGSRVWNKLASGVDASFLSTAQAGGFTGSTIGLYAKYLK